MSEIITLHGGPADGQQYAWSGGDMLELAVMPPVSISELNGPPMAPRPMYDRFLYRRSVLNRLAFVFQP